MNHNQSFAFASYRLAADLELKLLTANDSAMIAMTLANLEPWQSLGFTSVSLERYLIRIDPCLHRYCVLKAGAVVGVLAVRNPWLRGACLELLGLFTEYQQQGIGKQLVAWLITETAPRNANLWTTVSSINDRAYNFYLQQGFVPIGDIPDLIQFGSHETLLRLPITSAENIKP